MRRRHKKFNAHRFLDKFQGHEGILAGFVGAFDGQLSLKAGDVDVETFKEYLLSDAEDEGLEPFLEELYRIYDMSGGDREKCHEELLSACSEMNPPCRPDPKGELHLECLAMKVWVDNRAAFDLAYNMESYRVVDGFSFYKGAAGVEIEDHAHAALEFQAKLEEMFTNDEDTDRVRVSSYLDDGSVNFVVYHEKRKVSELVFGPKKTIKVQPLRPLQQDFVGYRADSGDIEIKARFKKETDALRKAFAEACLDDPDFFEDDGSGKRIDLSVLVSDGFELTTQGEDKAYLYEIWGNVKQKNLPRVMIRSKDAFETLDAMRLRHRLAPDRITKAVIYIHFGDEKRPKRVELSGTNGIKYNRTTHVEDVHAYLRDWGILLD
jgi:hypothetical protein